MSDAIVLEANKREVVGKKLHALRDQGLVPATIYEKGKESVNVQVPYMALVKAYAHAGMGQPVELTVEKKKYLTMITDVHTDPVKHQIVHVAFHAVNANDPVEAEVPVHIEGDVPAEKVGNFIVRPHDHVTVKALPADLPEALTVSADKLVEPGDHLTAADLSLPANVELISEPETVLATVEEPRVQEEPEASEEVDAADVPSAHGSEDAAEVKEAE